MANQLFEDGKVIVVDDVELECVGVGYQEPNGEREKYSYTFRVKSELDAEREEARKVAEEAAEQERLAEERRTEEERQAQLDLDANKPTDGGQ